MKSHMTSNGFWKWKKVLKELYCVTKNISLSVWLPAEASSLKKKTKRRERGSLPGSSYTNYYLFILVVKATLSAHMIVDAAQRYGVFR